MAAADPSNARCSEPIARQPGQVGEPLAVAARNEARRRVAGRRRRVGGEGRDDVAADLEPGRPDAGAKPGAYLVGGALRRSAHRGDGDLDDATGQAAPSGVGRADRTSPGRGKQHGQAVGSLDNAGDAGLGRDAAVGLVERGAGDAVAGADANDPRPMHLSQEDRRSTDHLGETAPVRGDGRGGVADRAADIHRVEGRAARPSGTTRHHGADAGDARVRRQPAGRDVHCASGQAEGCVEANAGSAMQASNTRITVGT